MRAILLPYSLSFASLSLGCISCALPASAVTAVNPTGVNVRSQGPTSVFLTFQGTSGQTSTSAFWCARVVPGVSGGSVVPFNPCLPGSLLGSLPSQFNLARSSGSAGVNNLTDIMTIPETIARKAYQQGGGFFYIRKFSGAGGDQYAVVTCRLGLGGARSPLSVMNLELRFEGQDLTQPVTSFSSTKEIRPFSALVKYNGSGRLIGQWEIVQPGDPTPTAFDLLPAASLPLEQRSQQTAYRVLAPFDIYLPPTGSAVINGPDPQLLNTGVGGDYRILFRLSASPASDSFSQTGQQVVAAGGVSGFSFPFLRYYVGGPSPADGASGSAVNRQPAASSFFAQVPGASPLTASVSVARTVGEDGKDSRNLYTFSWTPYEGALRYLLLFKTAGGDRFRALLPAMETSYEREPFWLDNIDQAIEWQVVAYGPASRILAYSTVASIQP